MSNDSPNGLKVLISAENLHQPIAGIGVYIYEMIKNLSQSELISNFHTFPANKLTNLKLFENPPEKNSANYFSTLLGGLNEYYFLYQLRQLYRDSSFRLSCKNIQTECTVYHEPSFILKRYQGPTVVSVHDLSHVITPEYHPSGRVEYLNRHLLNSMENANHIITISNVVKKQLVELFNVNSEKISVVYNGVGEKFRAFNESDIFPVLNKYNVIYKSYFLYVGTIEPRKNIEMLLYAYMLLPKKTRNMYPLLIVGGVGWRSEKLFEKIFALSRTENLQYLSYISNEELPALYSGAKLFLYPSKYEGFGIPVAEALKSGVPVITSKATSMEEITKGIGLYSDSNDSEGYSENIQEALENEVLYNQLVNEGLILSKNYTWGKCIQNTIDVYRKVI